MDAALPDADARRLAVVHTMTLFAPTTPWKADDVDLVVNCYERTMRAVLSPGFFPAIVAAFVLTVFAFAPAPAHVDRPALARAIG